MFSVLYLIFVYLYLYSANSLGLIYGVQCYYDTVTGFNILQKTEYYFYNLFKMIFGLVLRSLF